MKCGSSLQTTHLSLDRSDSGKDLPKTRQIQMHVPAKLLKHMFLPVKPANTSTVIEGRNPGACIFEMIAGLRDGSNQIVKKFLFL